jgi:folylpolyglutamate synthase/dihydropteroate synthase
MPASVVAEAAAALGLAVEVEPDVARAVDRAVGTAPDDTVLVTGSLYVVGAARTHLLGPPD